MKLRINGEPKTIELDDGGEAITLDALLERLDFRQVHLAVALNETFVPRSQHAETTVSDGDAIEIVAPMQGG